MRLLHYGYTVYTSPMFTYDLKLENIRNSTLWPFTKPCTVLCCHKTQWITCSKNERLLPVCSWWWREDLILICESSHRWYVGKGGGGTTRYNPDTCIRQACKLAVQDSSRESCYHSTAVLYLCTSHICQIGDGSKI